MGGFPPPAVSAVAEGRGSLGHVQAGFLRALADHLARHDLVMVNVMSDHSGGWDLQLLGRDAAGDLVGWARSLAASNGSVLSVRVLPEQVNVEFGTSVGDHRVRVWGCVEELRAAMGLIEGDRTAITVAELADFAEHATVPPRRGRQLRGGEG